MNDQAEKVIRIGVPTIIVTQEELLAILEIPFAVKSAISNACFCGRDFVCHGCEWLARVENLRRQIPERSLSPVRRIVAEAAAAMKRFKLGGQDGVQTGMQGDETDDGSEAGGDPRGSGGTL